MKNLNTITEILASLSTRAVINHNNLTVIPLRRQGHSEISSSLKMLDEAIAEKTVEVTEISEEGAVPSIRLKSSDDAPILILDGEELIGAKQDRIANLTILVPPCATLIIPVSCVEAGRWSSRSRQFGSSGHMQYSEARSRRASSVSGSLRSHGSHWSDQEEVWDGTGI